MCLDGADHALGGVDGGVTRFAGDRRFVTLTRGAEEVGLLGGELVFLAGRQVEGQFFDPHDVLIVEVGQVQPLGDLLADFRQCFAVVAGGMDNDAFARLVVEADVAVL